MITGNKHNIVNVDALHKYHTGVNTPSISEKLVNENVTSFKVGTSNVNGVDLTNQMEQSLVTLDNIEGRSVREDVDDNYSKIINCITLGGLELKSLPNGTKDTYSNGVYTKKINRVYFKDLNWSHFSDGASGTRTTIYRADIPDMTTCGDANSNDYNFTCSRYDLVNGNTQWVIDDECMSMCPFNKGVYLRVGKTSIPNASAINQYLGFHYIDYELENPIEEMRELNFLCKPNDIIDTKSPIPFTCSHTVQLNTKAQVEEAQKQIVKSNKSIWQKFKELTDVKMQINENGYIKFPTALGGLLIQWGRVENTPGIPEIRINLPVAYSEKIYGIQFTGQWGHSNHHYWVNGNSDYRTFITPVKIGSQDVVNASDPVYWFTIGK